ncbi:hypothetical protein SISNIDRAFT_449990 [Sistotremastrum niveocremeum HHB9708]|uniref:F-box domain-containing protein n=1 Tax=Sistotremastrum niveocremeum HHB9708 TaxID=1314777 RepID=A0A164YSQ1_9AGAM|nr:hypothetical protein SISNIDRAFT_449990 [Sistotremastrum niveocremeum HHB9708]
MFPAELCGKIAEQIRSTNRDGIQCNPFAEAKCWIRESQTLATLSLVSRMWRNESKVYLWSDVWFSDLAEQAVPTSSTDSRLEQRTSRFLSALHAADPTAVKYLKCFSFELHRAMMYRAELISNIQHILSLISQRAANLSLLRLTFHSNPECIPLLPHISSLRFPRLRNLHLHLLRFNREDTELLTSLILAYPDLEGLYLQGELGPYPWSSLRQTNTLPKLRRFLGDLATLALVPSSAPLISVKCPSSGIEMDLRLSKAFLKRNLSHLANPLTTVTEIILARGEYPLDACILKAIARSFPALQILDGLAISEGFIAFMGTDIEHLARCLPKLQSLTMYESCDRKRSYSNRKSFATPSNETVERIFADLPRLFPAIASASHIKTRHGTRSRPRQFMHMQFSAKGNTVKRSDP